MTYYEILEISENASQEVIKTAYKTLAKKYHPDIFQGEPKEAEEKMKQINIAYNVLSNSTKRAQYDKLLKNKKTSGNPEKQETHTKNPSEFCYTQQNHSIIINKKMFIIVFLVICVSIISCLVLFISTKNIEQVKDSVVMVEVYNDNSDIIATGSGFCTFKSNWIITNFHVIEGAKAIAIITDEHEKIPVIDIILFNKNQDLAILEIDGKLTPLSLGNGEKIKTKDSVTTIGSPKGELNTVSEGIISNIDNKTQIRISAPISQGSSGGVLLNRKNEVIGITNAGYNDAQNLNYAINISVLEDLYYNYKKNGTITISDNNLYNYIGSLTDFDGYMSSETGCYRTSSLNTFFNLTDNNKRFEQLLEQTDSSWHSIYNSLSSNDKKQVIDLFLELNNYTFDDYNVDDDINSWDTADFFISLGVLNEYELAITYIDINNYSDKNLMFDNVNENYPLETAEKTLIIYLIGEYNWYDIHDDNKEDIFDYFDAKYGTEDLGAILEMLGYEVVYENDGSITAYW